MSFTNDVYYSIERERETETLQLSIIPHSYSIVYGGVHGYETNGTHSLHDQNLKKLCGSLKKCLFIFLGQYAKDQKRFTYFHYATTKITILN